MIEFSCPKCSKQLRVRDEHAGRGGVCECGTTLVVPAATENAAFEVAIDVEGRLAVLETSATPFWRTGIGRAIRWIAFIPVGYLLPVLIILLFALFVWWLYSMNVKSLVILYLFFGGAALTVLIITCMALYWSVVWALQGICPNPRVGSIIYGTLWGLNLAWWLLTTFVNWPGFGTLFCGVVVNAIIFGAIRSAYVESSRDGTDRQ